MDFLTNRDIPLELTNEILATAAGDPKELPPLLEGRRAVLLFEKTSTRTRFSFERALNELGCTASYTDWRSTNFVKAHAVDEVRVIGDYTDLLLIRMGDHDLLSQMAEATPVPIINCMTDLAHPCQALADALTISQHCKKPLAEVVVAYAGDLTNVLRSLAEVCCLLGAQLKAAVPEPARTPDAMTARAQREGRFAYFDNVADAVANADVVYTDTWVSLGQESERSRRLELFRPFAITQEVFELAKDTAVFMHCLPAERGVEVANDVFDHPRSVVFQQAYNRYTTAKALLYHLHKAGPGA